LLLTVLIAAPGAAEEAPEGSGESYWGPIPPPTPETTATFEGRRRAAWEWPLYGTYRVVGFPFQMVAYGLRTTVIALDESSAIDRIAEVLGAVELPYGFRASVDVGTVAGNGYGLAFFHDELFDDAARLQLRAQMGTAGRSRFTGGLLLPRPHGGFLDLGLGYHKDGRARFYGLGPSSMDADLARFTSEWAWAGATWRRGLSRGFAVEGIGLYTTLRNRGSFEADDPAVTEQFEDRIPSGWGDPSDGFDLALGLLQDTTTTDGRPTAGGIRRVKFGWFLPTTEDNGYFHTRAELTQFLRLWWGRGLALRGTWAWLDANDGAVHFQRQFQTDRPDEIRGFAPGRFRGRDRLPASRVPEPSRAATAGVPPRS